MEERITRAEFARRAGVNKSTVTRWIENGRITIGPDGLLDEAEAHSQRAASESPAPHHQARKAQLELTKASNPTGVPSAAPQTAAERAARATTTATQSTATAKSAPDGEPSGDQAADALDPPPASDTDAVVRRTRYAQMLEREAVARMKAREDQEAAGQLIRRSAVERAMTDAAAVILNAAETLPDRAAPLLVGIDDQARIRAMLRDEMEQFLATASTQLALVVEGRT